MCTFKKKIFVYRPRSLFTIFVSCLLSSYQAIRYLKDRRDSDRHQPLITSADVCVPGKTLTSSSNAQHTSSSSILWRHRRKFRAFFCLCRRQLSVAVEIGFEPCPGDTRKTTGDRGYNAAVATVEIQQVIVTTSLFLAFNFPSIIVLSSSPQ